MRSIFWIDRPQSIDNSGCLGSWADQSTKQGGAGKMQESASRVGPSSSLEIAPLDPIYTIKKNDIAG